MKAWPGGLPVGMLGDLPFFSSVTGRGEFTFHIWILVPNEVCAVSWGKFTFFIWILGLSEVCAFFYFKLPSSTQVHNPFRVKSGLWAGKGNLGEKVKSQCNLIWAKCVCTAFYRIAEISLAGLGKYRLVLAYIEFSMLVWAFVTTVSGCRVGFFSQERTKGATRRNF